MISTKQIIIIERSKMNIKFCLLLLFTMSIFLSAQQKEPSEEAERFFDEADSFLREYVHNGLIDYDSIAADRTRLNKLVKKMADFDLSELKSKEERIAFWINAYNITVIKAVVDNYPITSPLKVDGFFKTTKHPAAGFLLTLDEIEHRMLFGIERDPRFHFVLVCAAISCPELIEIAYLPDTLEEQLESRTKYVINNEKFVRVSDKEKTVFLFKIFDWYRKDFEGENYSVIDYLNKYRNIKIPNEYKIEFMEYDWTLNDLSTK